MDEYTEAKFRIFANQGPGDTFVGNLDDPRIATLAEGENAARVHARALWFALSPAPEHDALRSRTRRRSCMRRRPAIRGRSRS